jgi:ABC-type transport system substrate-binding protein
MNNSSFGVRILVGGLFVLFGNTATSGECEKVSDMNSRLTIKITEDSKLPYDPTTSGLAHITFYNAVLGRLVVLNSNLSTEPSLLESAYWDFDSKTYRLRLRSGLKFHNGRNVTAEDIDFSLSRFFLTTGRADPIAFLKNIDDIENLKRGGKYRPWSVKGIAKIDSRTVAIKLNSPNPAFLYSLADGWASLVPKEEMYDDLVTWKRFPIGAGVYKVMPPEGSVVTLCKIDASFQGPAMVEFVSDPETPANFVGLAANGDRWKQLKKQYGVGPIGFAGIFFNRFNRLARNQHFRKALSMALDRAAFVKLSEDYSLLNEVLPSNFYGRHNQPAVFDIAAAKSELSKIPSDLVPKGKLRAYWYTGRKSVVGVEAKVINLVQQSLKAIGVDVAFEYSDYPTFRGTDSEAVFRVDERGTKFPDPLAIFRAFETPAFLSPLFPEEQSMTEFQALLREASLAESLDVKSGAIAKLSRYFTDYSIVVPLFERKTIYWVDQSRISDIGIQTGIAIDLDKITLVGVKK